MTIGIIAISIIFMVIGMAVQWRLKSKFSQYSEVPTSSGMSGVEVAQKMLKDNGIYDVQVTSVEGSLTDHYNPLNKTVNLSTDVYNGRNVSRSEEHTSELQSQSNLVCRLLLEKKKKTKKQLNTYIPTRK